MTINSVPAKSWSQHNNQSDDPKYNKCSPNLVALRVEMEALWKVGNLGCYGERDVRGGELPSAHSHGAAIDLRYLEQIGRARFVNEVVPWLISNSEELHIGAIHDYIGGWIWHSGRTNNVSDAYTKWWKTQTPNASTGMGQAWAGWVHIETTEPGWADGTAVIQRLTSFPPTTPHPQPVPPQIPEDDMSFLLYRDKRFNNVFRLGASAITVSGAIVEKEGGEAAVITDVHDQTLIACMRSSRLTMAEMVLNGEAGKFPAFKPPADLLKQQGEPWTAEP